MSFGIGVYFLTVLWFITFMLCWISVRTGHYIGKIAVAVSLLLTIILVCLPKNVGNNLHDANFYDKLFIPRFVILTFLWVSALVGGVFSFIHVCLAPIETRKVRRFGTVE